MNILETIEELRRIEKVHGNLKLVSNEGDEAEVKVVYGNGMACAVWVMPEDEQ